MAFSVEDSIRILLVDDNPHDRALIARELAKEYSDVSFLEVIDQTQFSSALANDTFDLAITDFQLLWTDGLKVLQAVKASRPNCPVIMFTATGSEEIAVEAMKNGLDEYIIKNVKHLIRLRAAVRLSLEHATLHAKAKQLESRLSSLLSHLKVGVFSASSDGEIIETNEALASILGYDTPVQLVGKRIESFFVDRELISDHWHEILDDRSANEFEALLLCKDGSVVWTSLALAITDECSDEIIIEGLVDDISERKAAEEKLKKNESELAHIGRLMVMGEMVAGIAHEIGQPLGAISNFSNASIRALEDPENANLDLVRKSVRRIAEQSMRAGEIIRGLRRFVSRQGNSKKQIDVHEIIRESVDLLAFELRQTNVRIIYELSEEVPMVDADRVQIQQVVVNLLRNAADSLTRVPPEDRSITVSTRITEIDDEARAIQVAVSDCGPGLDEQEIDSLFQPFVTTKPDGLGMGLAISSSLVADHGGRIWHEAPSKSGATFCFSLPLSRRSEHAA